MREFAWCAVHVAAFAVGFYGVTLLFRSVDRRWPR